MTRFQSLTTEAFSRLQVQTGRGFFPEYSSLPYSLVVQNELIFTSMPHTPPERNTQDTGAKYIYL